MFDALAAVAPSLDDVSVFDLCHFNGTAFPTLPRLATHIYLQSTRWLSDSVRGEIVRPGLPSKLLPAAP